MSIRASVRPRFAPALLVALLAACSSDASGPSVTAGPGGGLDPGSISDEDTLADAATDATPPVDTASDDVATADDVDAGVADVPEVALDAAPDVAPDVAEDVAPVEDVAADVGTQDADAGTPDADAGPTGIGPTCFAEIWDPTVNGPDYDQFSPTVADHCLGTDHQDLGAPGLVVFLGDSVTVGTPNLEHALPTDNDHFWRNKLATWIRDTYDLPDGGFVDYGLWKSYDVINGVGGKQVAGSFRNCSKWGARTDDLAKQIDQCLPNGGSPQPTLVVFTMGGNDIAKITQVGGEASDAEVAAGYPQAWALAESTLSYLHESLTWLKDPARFPNGSQVIFANPFEFTDGTGKTDACPVAPLAGYKPWKKPEVLEEVVIYILEGYMDIAVQTDTDLIFMLESFCGHGWVATGPNADVSNRCYRGPDAGLWFDDTCIHPNAAGHGAIFEMFRAEIEE
jgi:lysophospholipase L1-like esterase